MLSKPLSHPRIDASESDSEATRVAGAAERRLRDSSYPGLRFVQCEFHEGVLIIRGQVTSFYLKQLAQTFVRSIRGISEIDNRLEVVEPRDRRARQTT